MGNKNKNTAPAEAAVDFTDANAAKVAFEAALADKQALEEDNQEQVLQITKLNEQLATALADVAKAGDGAGMKALQDEVQTLTETVTELKDALAKKTMEATLKMPVFSYNGDDYKAIAMHFKYKGVKHGIEVLEENTELLGILVKMGVGFLQKIVKK